MLILFINYYTVIVEIRQWNAFEPVIIYIFVRSWQTHVFIYLCIGIYGYDPMDLYVDLYVNVH